jgi:bacteriorhodopsin
MEKIKTSVKTIDWAEITETRYIDWSITTPMMLLTLCLVLGQNSNTKVKLHVMGAIVILNYIMLYLGYLGEKQQLGRTTSMLTGFVAFFAMFAIIFMTFVKPKYNTANYVLYSIYLVVWSLYGFVYMLNEELKNIAMNILDFIAKCFIGLGLWVYYTKIVILK